MLSSFFSCNLLVKTTCVGFLAVYVIFFMDWKLIIFYRRSGLFLVCAIQVYFTWCCLVRQHVQYCYLKILQAFVLSYEVSICFDSRSISQSATLVYLSLGCNAIFDSRHKQHYSEQDNLCASFICYSRLALELNFYFVDDFLFVYTV